MGGGHHHDGAVEGHGQPVGANTALELDVVDDVGQHGQDQVGRRGRAQALQDHADGHRHNLPVAQARDDAARGAHRHAPEHHEALAKPIGQQHHEHRHHP